MARNGQAVYLSKEFIREAREKRDQTSAKNDGIKINFGAFVEAMARKGWGNEPATSKKVRN